MWDKTQFCGTKLNFVPQNSILCHKIQFSQNKTQFCQINLNSGQVCLQNSLCAQNSILSQKSILSHKSQFCQLICIFLSILLPTYGTHVRRATIGQKLGWNRLLTRPSFNFFQSAGTNFSFKFRHWLKCFSYSF